MSTDWLTLGVLLLKDKELTKSQKRQSIALLSTAGRSPTASFISPLLFVDKLQELNKKESAIRQSKVRTEKLQAINDQLVERSSFLKRENTRQKKSINDLVQRESRIKTELDTARGQLVSLQDELDVLTQESETITEVLTKDKEEIEMLKQVNEDLIANVKGILYQDLPTDLISSVLKAKLIQLIDQRLKEQEVNFQDIKPFIKPTSAKTIAKQYGKLHAKEQNTRLQVLELYLDKLRRLLQERDDIDMDKPLVKLLPKERIIEIGNEIFEAHGDAITSTMITRLQGMRSMGFLLDKLELLNQRDIRSFAKEAFQLEMTIGFDAVPNWFERFDNVTNETNEEPSN